MVLILSSILKQENIFPKMSNFILKQAVASLTDVKDSENLKNS